jgi:hypothetical protein
MAEQKATTPAAKAASKAKAAPKPETEATETTQTQEQTQEQETPTVKAAAKKVTKSQAKKIVGATEVKNFDLNQTATAIELLNEADIMNMIPDLIDETGINDFKLGGALARVQENKWWKDAEYESFNAYCDDLFSGGYRKAMYLITIYKTLVEKEIPWDAVKSIGWSKLKELLQVITKDNVAEWAEKAGHMTLVQLSQHVKDHLASTKEGGDQPPAGDSGSMSTLAFRMYKDQRDIVEATLDTVKASAGEPDMKKEIALVILCEEFSSGAPKTPDPKKAIVDSAKKLGWQDALTLLADLFEDEIDINASPK